LLIGAGFGVAIVGVIAFRFVNIGYQTPGTPIYRSDAKVNRDTAEISKFVPSNFAWVVLETPEYPDPRSTMGTKTLRMTDDLGNYLIAKGDALAVLDFANVAEKPMNQLLHNGSPKYFALPDTEQLSAALWNFFFGASAPDEPRTYFAHEPSARSANVRILLPDHTTARLNKLRSDLDTFAHERVAKDPDLKDVHLRYVGGEAGLYQAIDDVTANLNLRNLILTLATILVAGSLLLGSPVAGLLLLLLAVMANFLGFLFMDIRGIGLTVDTVPVLSLGIGIGIVFSIYLLAAIRSNADAGLALDDAVAEAFRTTGHWVVASFVVIIGALVPWAFSPLLFHNEMSSILILLMATNLIAALLILPALVAWLRPGFLVRRSETQADVTGNPASRSGKAAVRG
jgi:predicted RND superfamily exporter protein